MISTLKYRSLAVSYDTSPVRGGADFQNGKGKLWHVSAAALSLDQ